MVLRTVTLWLTGLLTVTYLTLTIASPHFPIWAFYVIAMLNGTVMGIVISMNTVLSQHLVPKRYVESATSILTLGRSLGQTVMTGSYGTALTLIIRANICTASRSPWPTRPSAPAPRPHTTRWSTPRS